MRLASKASNCCNVDQEAGPYQKQKAIHFRSRRGGKVARHLPNPVSRGGNSLRMYIRLCSPITRVDTNLVVDYEPPLSSSDIQSSRSSASSELETFQEYARQY